MGRKFRKEIRRLVPEDKRYFARFDTPEKILQEHEAHAADLRKAIQEARNKSPNIWGERKNLHLKRMKDMETWLANTEKTIIELKKRYGLPQGKTPDR
jgi:hypothetical protein